MPRKLVCISAFLFLIVSITAAQSSRHFTFHYAFTIKKVPEGQKIRVWFPAAHSAAFFEIHIRTVRGGA